MTVSQRIKEVLATRPQGMSRSLLIRVLMKRHPEQINKNNVAQALHRMVGRGDVSNPKKGTYVLVDRSDT